MLELPLFNLDKTGIQKRPRFKRGVPHRYDVQVSDTTIFNSDKMLKK